MGREVLSCLAVLVEKMEGIAEMMMMGAEVDSSQTRDSQLFPHFLSLQMNENCEEKC